MLALFNACRTGGREAPPVQDRIWPAYLGSASRAGAASAIGADPQPVWRATLARGITGAPALTEELVVVGLADHRVAVLERATGSVIWTRRLDLAIGAGPLVADDRIFVAEQTLGGRVYALRLSNGLTLWSARLGDVTAPLALEDSALYAASLEGWVARYNIRTGHPAWRVRMPGGVRAAIVPVPEGLVVATTTDSLFLLDRATGAVKARRATRGTILAAPALADSLLIFGTSAGRLEAVRPATLRTAWSLELREPIVGSVAVQRGRVYALTGRGTLVTMTANDSSASRLVRLGLVARAGPTPTAQGVYVVAVNGEIALVDSTGTRKWTARVEPPVAEPVLADQHLLIAVSMRGDIVAFR